MKRHTPQRTCVICRRTAGKRSLFRVVRAAEGGVSLDPSGKRAGRGAYLCPDPACWERAVRGDALERALRGPLSPAERQALAAHAPTPSELRFRAQSGD
ncbi:MAG: RNase P modulator RnpM [Candidatus Promineifilaceae bacterium]